MTSAAGRDLALLFYNDWPLGYHNVEAERKARFFAEAGFRVGYVPGIGVRNPRPARAVRAADLLARALLQRGAAEAQSLAGVAQVGVLALPPRQLGLMRALNERWIMRRLDRGLPGWRDGVAWVRAVTPEVVGALSRARPRAVVFEITDAHWLSPQLAGPWQEPFVRAERRLAQLCDVVLTTSLSLVPRYEQWGATVRYAPHGVDLPTWSARDPRGDRPGAVLGFLGTLDYRLDASIVRHVAARRPDWRVRLIGPVEQGFDPGAVADLANVSVEPAVPHARVTDVLGELDVAFMPYAVTPLYTHGFPLKALEAFAVGLPVVVRPNENVDELGELVYCAQDAGEFLHMTQRALREDTPERARARRAFAEQRTWDVRLRELLRVLDDLLAARA